MLGVFRYYISSGFVIRFVIFFPANSNSSYISTVLGFADLVGSSSRTKFLEISGCWNIFNCTLYKIKVFGLINSSTS